MTTTIAKDFHWEMAHRLPFHEGGCRNIHGHSYAMRVEIEGEPDANGMVLDYYDVKTLVQPLVDRLDHSFLCDRSDTVMMQFFETAFAEHPLKVNYLDVPTTAENIARYIINELAPAFSTRTNITTLRVRVHETARTFAEVQMTFR